MGKRAVRNQAAETVAKKRKSAGHLEMLGRGVDVPVGRVVDVVDRAAVVHYGAVRYIPNRAHGCDQLG